MDCHTRNENLLSLSLSLSLFFSLSQSNFEKFHPISRILFQFWLGDGLFFKIVYFFRLFCLVFFSFSRKQRRRASERSLDIKSIRSERQEIYWERCGAVARRDRVSSVGLSSEKSWTGNVFRRRRSVADRRTDSHPEMRGGSQRRSRVKAAKPPQRRKI